MTTLDEIQARADAATEGPWEARLGIGGLTNGKRVVGPREQNDLAQGPIVLMEPLFWDSRSARNAEFIAHAREDVPALVSALKAVEAVVSERYKLWAAICGETCGKEVYGIDHDAIADSIAAAIETAIREALA